MRRKRPAEFGSLSAIPNEQSRFKTGSSRETDLRGTNLALSAVFAAVLFSRIRYGQFCIAVRGHDVDCCDLGSWQHDLLGVPEPALVGQAMAGQSVVLLTSVSAIMNATAVFMIEVDVPNRILDGSIYVRPKE
jgi:hypothetical protein